MPAIHGRLTMKNPGPRILHTHRQTVHVIERAKVYVKDGRVLSQIAEDGSFKSFNIPFANISVLFLGHGTSISNDAARLLSDEGTYVAFTGTGGTPLLHGSLTNYQVTDHIHKMIPVVACEQKSLQAARIIMQKRCDLLEQLPGYIATGPVSYFRRTDASGLTKPFMKKCNSAKTSKSFMGYEGTFAKSVYAKFAQKAGLSDFKRSPGADATNTMIDRVNGRIDHGNYLAYGIAGAVLWALGIPPSLSVLHGKTRAGGLVFDLADSFKDALVLPLAFSEYDNEKQFRSKMICAIQDHDILKRCFETMSEILKLSDEFQAAAA